MPVSTPLKTSFEKLLTPPIAPPTKLPAAPPIESCVFDANLSIDPPTLPETSDFNAVTNFNPLDPSVGGPGKAGSISTNDFNLLIIINFVHIVFLLDLLFLIFL